MTDLSGNRRFICVEVTAPIETNITIDYKQLYAQAVHAIHHRERYWLDDADEAVLKESNEEFRQASPLEQLFHHYFQMAGESEGEWYTTMQIFSYLQKNTREKFSNGKVVILAAFCNNWECRPREVVAERYII